MASYPVLPQSSNDIPTAGPFSGTTSGGGPPPSLGAPGEEVYYVPQPILTTARETENNASEDGCWRPCLRTQSASSSNTIVVHVPPAAIQPIFAHRQWRAGMLLADAIWSGALDVRDQTVAELGAGTGLPGIMAARCGASYLVSTDYDSSALISMLHRNLERNLDPKVLQKRVHVVGHTWGHDVEEVVDCLVGHRRESVAASFTFDTGSDFDNLDTLTLDSEEEQEPTTSGVKNSTVIKPNSLCASVSASRISSCITPLEAKKTFAAPLPMSATASEVTPTTSRVFRSASTTNNTPNISRSSSPRPLVPSEHLLAIRSSFHPPVLQPRFDTLLLADCIWDPLSHASLLKSICNLLAPPSTVSASDTTTSFTASANRRVEPRVYLVSGLHTGREKIVNFLRRARRLGLALVPLPGMDTSATDDRRGSLWPPLNVEEECQEGIKTDISCSMHHSTITNTLPGEFSKYAQNSAASIRVDEALKHAVDWILELEVRAEEDVADLPSSPATHTHLSTGGNAAPQTDPSSRVPLIASTPRLTGRRRRFAINERPEERKEIGGVSQRNRWITVLALGWAS